MDNVVDRTIYPLEKQKEEAESKRRMGLGITGLANAAEMCGYPYASQEFLNFAEEVLTYAERLFLCSQFRFSIRER